MLLCVEGGMGGRNGSTVASYRYKDIASQRWGGCNTPGLKGYTIARREFIHPLKVKWKQVKGFASRYMLWARRGEAQERTIA